MEDKTPKQKKPVRRIKSVASPEPEGPTGGFFEEMESTCGHSACTGGKCNVRYVGPVTQIRDHHIVHASRNASHVWSAAIVSGLAVVLTGAIGYAAFGAEATNPGGTLYGEFQQINQRLDKIEEGVNKLLDRCQMSSSCSQNATLNQSANSQMNNTQTAQPNECVRRCNDAYPESQEKAAACAKDKCGTASGGEQQTQDQCMLQCRKDNPDNADGINSCYKTKCTQPTQTQEPTGDQCQQQCTQKFEGLDLTAEQKAAGVKTCIDRNCSTTQTQEPAGDQCTATCKEKYKDNQAAINSCLIEKKCPGYEALQSSTVTAACQKKCTATRETCSKEAGANVVAMRTCYAKEAECKKACSK